MGLSGAVLLVLCQQAMSSFVDVPKIKMLDGREMPGIGLGTYLGFDQSGVIKSKDKQLRDVVLKAIDIGYRHFDTASIYDTEAEIGEAIRTKISEGVVKREDVFITTKLWNTQHKREEVTTAIKEVLNKTGLDYVDLFLIHWPIGLNADYSYSDVDYMETWRGMEDVQRLGLAKSIGLSNFNREQLQRVLNEGSVKPVALQIEVHPQIIQKDLISFAKSEGIVVLGYSPFGSLVMRYGIRFPGPRMDDPVLVTIAQKYGKTPAQVVLRWVVDRNVVPLPKTVNPKRLVENINIFDFKLTPEEIEKINQFNSNTRYTLPSFWQTHPYYPFEKVPNPISDPFRG
ncbi:aldo-keto reductase AKR2E4-like isoform X2 [Trichoplusia ni]|uniref:Aldo-keto reductase AKR2E4-like isoform X2 n=1 Tax=Trichoplusia ni TaxID=7111 RepID=A0A7E5W807_TRINI|nr:aldo-keto reductase AKR2E4-like isoform X2 [Trichoplusia ni]XP_026736628.1 aldo-keto reductase AKR2E4-like isoform X2 [Trichoplusia ni]